MFHNLKLFNSQGCFEDAVRCVKKICESIYGHHLKKF